MDNPYDRTAPVKDAWIVVLGPAAHLPGGRFNFELTTRRAFATRRAAVKYAATVHPSHGKTLIAKLEEP